MKKNIKIIKLQNGEILLANVERDGGTQITISKDVVMLGMVPDGTGNGSKMAVIPGEFVFPFLKENSINLNGSQIVSIYTPTQDIVDLWQSTFDPNRIVVPNNGPKQLII